MQNSKHFNFNTCRESHCDITAVWYQNLELHGNIHWILRITLDDSIIVISIPNYGQRLCFVCVLHVRNAGSCIFI